MDTLALSHEIERYDLSSCIIDRQGKRIFHHEQVKQASSQLMPVNSCTKSVLSSLICIAADQGLLPPVDTQITQFFPQLLQDSDERKHHITLRHLLTLTAGFSWTEFGGANSFPRMTRSADWIGFVLEQPMASMPGTTMVYNSGASQLLAAILTQVTGTTLTQFAEDHLFGPLGIQQYEWKRDPQGIHTGGFGLELTAHDMLRFGRLFVQKGLWNNQTLISQAMVERSTEAAIPVSPPERGLYAWHWWVDSVAIKLTSTDNHSDDHSSSLPFYYARGFGGQFIVIVPSLEAIIVMTRQQRKKGLSPLDFFREQIAPILAAKGECYR